MPDYDFSSLNDKEFEVLAVDLLSKRDGKKYERFKPGKDAGVDGRFFNEDGTEIILQCKHWSLSSLAKLKRHLVKFELPKVNKINPSRYILVVSHSLSRKDKFEISSSLFPHIKNPADIVGREDLNDLLSENGETEIKHYKLWISSSAILRYLIDKPISDRSEFVLKDIRDSVNLYVPTVNHDLALEKLEEKGTVIITGPAGIGKTTLADNLVLYYVAQGFSFVKIAEEIREAEAVYQSDEKQVFYFDDFLGRNYLEALSGHEGAHIVHFINRIRRDKKKRFVLTSRSTILNQGRLLIDIFQTHNLSNNEFEVSFDSFSEMDKARILYNHIWHSFLDAMYIDELYFDRRYRRIISHKNFNPRLIRYITDSERLNNCKASQYWHYAQSLLDNPDKVWENPFEAQHDDFGRALILLVTLNARDIAESELAEAYARFIGHPDAKAMQGRRDFLHSLRHLSGSMLTRKITGGKEPLINLFNPSIGDFVLHRYSSDIPSLRAGFCSLMSLSSLKTLSDLERNGLISSGAKIIILNSLVDAAGSSGYVGYSVEYIAFALVSYGARFIAASPCDSRIASAAEFVVKSECPSCYYEALEVLRWRYENELSSHEEVASFLSLACERGATMDEISKLSELTFLLPDEHASKLWTKIEELAVSYFSDSVREEFPDEDVFGSVNPGDTYEAEKSLAELVEKRFVELGVRFDNSSVKAVIDAFDVSDRIDEYFWQEPDYDYREGRVFSDFKIDEIDDLFDRDN